jgi:hypothetical protein
LRTYSWGKGAMSNKYLCSLLGGLATSVAVFLVEAGLARAGMHGDTTFFDDALMGIFAALALFFLLRHRDMERELVRQKQYASVIADLNHHIRNALQVIVCRTELDIHGIPEIQGMREAVHRIDWALREILPSRAASPGPGTAMHGEVAASPSEPPARHTDPLSTRQS